MKTLLRYFFLAILIPGLTRAGAVVKTGSGTDATLKSIVLSTATTLVFSTGPSDYNYTTSVSPGTATLSIEPTTNDPAATVTVNGVPVASGASSGQITLNGIVTTTINMLVTASDGVTTHSYTIVVYETGSNNAFLSALTVSTGNALVATATGPGDFNYTTSVSPTITSLTVTPTTADATASISYNGTNVPSGTASPSILLNASGTTTITVVVTAQDGVTTQSYCIIVSKTGSNTSTLSSLSVSTNTNLTLSTGSSNFNYTTVVNNSVTSLKVTPTATDATATITVNGTTVASGVASGSITLNGSGTTTISLIVTAQDGVTKTTYSIVVSKGAKSLATLSSIVLSTNTNLVPSSGSSNINYTTSVTAGTTSLTVTPTATDPNATITINGVVVASGAASGPITLNTSGTTTINISVKSQDATTTITTGIVVSENGSNNANTYSIVLNPNSTLVGSSGSSNVNYTTSVSNATTSVTVTPTPSDPTATVTVNGVVVTSATGYTSNSIPLNGSGTTLVTVLVTAQDGVTSISYGITISKGGSNNATVSSIVLSTAVLNPACTLVGSSGSSSVNYVTSVASGTTTLTVTTTTVDNQAKISVNGSSQILGTSAIPVTLNASGTTFIGIVITSEDGSTTKSYGITVSKNGSNNANITSVVLSSGTTLTGTTGPSSLNYTTIVSPHTTTLTVTTTTVDANAKVTVNGFAAPNSSPSDPIALNATGTTTINILVTAQDGVTTKSVAITVSKSGAIIAWTGNASNSFASSSNWSPAKVPGAGDVATFGVSAYTGAANQPTISSNLTVAEVEFGTNNSPTLSITGGFTLSVGTSLTVDAGSTAIIKSASSTASVNISSLATVNITGNGTLTINSPIKFTLKSNSAGSASVGQLAGTSSISGTVYVERYIQGGSSVYRGYRLLTSSVYAATVNNSGVNVNVYSLNYVQTSSLVTGNNATGGFDKVGNPSLYLFREDQPTNSGSFTGGNYWGISKINNPTVYNYNLNGLATNYNIPVGNGFFFFYRGDRTNVANKYTAGTVAESVTMTESGFLNAGPITVHDWYTPVSPSLGYTTLSNSIATEGLNLIGNPYASSIDWDTYNDSSPGTGVYVTPIGGNQNNPSVGATIYILDPVSKNYGVYIANSAFGGTNNATHIIPSGQGFFVQASDPTAQLTFNESAKTTVQVTGPNLLLGTPKASAISQYLHLKLFQDAFQADEIFIGFNNTAQSKFVSGEDAAQKPGYGIANLASMSSDGVSLSINTLKLPAQSETIPLNVNSAADGAYELAVPEIKSIPVLFDIWLMDAYKKDSVNLRQNPSYSFNIVNSDALSYGPDRFSLVIRQNPALALHLVSFAANRASNGAQIIWKTVNEQNYTNFTVERSIDNGKTFDVLNGFQSSDLGTYSFLDKYPSATTNQYRLKLSDVNGAITYSNVVTLSYSNLANSIVSGNISVYPNPTRGIINLAIAQSSSSAPVNSSALQTVNLIPGLASQTNSTQSYDIKIISINGAVIKNATSQQPNWQDNVGNLPPGTYFIQVLNSNNKSLVGKSTFIKL